MTNEEIKYLQNKIKLAKAEAIKEFAERLKTKCTKSYYYDYKKCISVHENKVDIKDIDNLVKEMEGDA